MGSFSWGYIGGVVVAAALGGALVLVGAILLLNLGGAGDLVVRRVTSQPLGDLAPGYAATPRGFRTYASLVLAIGIVCIALWIAGWSAPLGAALLAAGVLGFVAASVVAIRGEVTTYRSLKR